jgi:hypothetical protein
MTENDAYRAELEEEIAFQRQNLDSLQRDRKKLPWLFVITLSSVPAGVLFGWIWFVGLFVVSIIFLVCGSYIVAGHTNEYSIKLQALESELKKLR